MANRLSNQFQLPIINQNEFQNLDNTYVDSGVFDRNSVSRVDVNLSIYGLYKSEIEIRNVFGNGQINILIHRNFTFFLCYYVFKGLRVIYHSAQTHRANIDFYVTTDVNRNPPKFNMSLKHNYRNNDFGNQRGYFIGYVNIPQNIVNRIVQNIFDYVMFQFLFGILQTIYQNFPYTEDVLREILLTIDVIYARRNQFDAGNPPRIRDYIPPIPIHQVFVDEDDNNVFQQDDQPQLNPRVRRRPNNRNQGIPQRNRVPRELANLGVRQDQVQDIIRQNRGPNTRNRARNIQGSIAQRIIQRRAANQRNVTRNSFHGIFKKFNNDSKTTIMNMLGVGYNPFTQDGMCFITSFILSQVRFVHMDPFNVTVSKPERNVRACNENEHILFTFNNMSLEQSSFCYSDNNVSTIVCGNCLPFTRDGSKDDLLVYCAHLIQMYVEDVYREDIDSNHFAGIPQCLSNLFQIVFHIFSSELHGREQVIYPQNPNFFENRVHKHVYLFKQNQHMFPISHIRLFLNYDKMRNSYFLCDYCQFICTKTKEKCEAHIKKCIQRKNFVNFNTWKLVDKAIKPECFYRFKPKFDQFVCNVCNEECSLESTRNNHICFISKSNTKDTIPDEKLYALDIESMQVDVGVGKKKHVCVLICVRSIYNNQRKYQFRTEEEFTDFLCMNHQQFENSTFIAHNGGGYDYQFFLKYWERLGYLMDIIPRPGSKHKYLEIKLKQNDLNIRFIDFMMLVPDSLRNVGESFALPIQKGDFPHRFLNENTIHYVGKLPLLHSEEDYFGFLEKKSAADQEGLETWYNIQKEKYCHCEGEHNCDLPLWNCWEFLVEYCWLDVDVLGDAAKLYRDLIMNLKDSNNSVTWTGKGTDPFTCITQSQLAMEIFLSGFQVLPKIYIPNQNKPNFNWRSIQWLEGMQHLFNYEIDHIGNSVSQYYVHDYNILFDGSSSFSHLENGRHTLFLFKNCKDYGCPTCCNNDEIHSTLKKKYVDIFNERELIIQSLLNSYDIVQVFEHEFRAEEEPFDFERYQVYQDREIFYGGRTEVFSPYLNTRLMENTEINHHDVCSMYPFVCASKKLPIGIPSKLYGRMIDRTRLSPTSPNPYFGFAKVRIKPNQNDFLGLLPSRNEEGRLMFHLLEQTGFWHTSEIYLAMENGYEIIDIYQVIHFTEENCSNDVFRGYMDYFLRLKIESEGWKKMGASSESPPEQEKIDLCEIIYRRNGNLGKPRKEEVHKNPVLRKIAKIFLNCLWGKFCQVQNKEVFFDITCYQDFEYLIHNSQILNSRIQFRYTPKGTVKTTFELESHKIKPNNKYNIFLAASVTAESRCILHSQMLLVGPERMIYCDTDSVVFYSQRGEGLQYVDPYKSLGHFADEHPNEHIYLFFAIAPKFYFIVTDEDIEIKSKGIWLTQENKLLLNEEAVKSMIQNYFDITKEETSIVLRNMSIYSNSTDDAFDYATLFTRYNQKRVSCQYSKREKDPNLEEVDFEFLSRIRLFPVGYHN
jgi:hypothetical protein